MNQITITPSLAMIFYKSILLFKKQFITFKFNGFSKLCGGFVSYMTNFENMNIGMSNFYWIKK